jgi:hypothetical protein
VRRASFNVANERSTEFASFALADEDQRNKGLIA